MPVVAAGLLPFIGAGAGAAGSIAGGIIGAGASGDAAETQADAATAAAQLQYKASQEALALQKQMWEASQTQQQPWLEAGRAGLSGLLGGMGLGTLSQQTTTPVDPYATERTNYQTSVDQLKQRINQPGISLRERENLREELLAAERRLEQLPRAPGAETNWAVTPGDATATGYGDLMKNFSQEDFIKDPGYDFRMQEGMNALNQSAAAKGMPFGGAAAKAAIQYGQNLGSNEYSNAYNRFVQDQTNRYNKLASLAGLGQTTAQNLSASGSNYAANAGNILTNSASSQGDYLTQAANARASGYVGGANAWGNALSGIGNNLSSYYLLNQLLG